MRQNDLSIYSPASTPRAPLEPLLVSRPANEEFRGDIVGLTYAAPRDTKESTASNEAGSLKPNHLLRLLEQQSPSEYENLLPHLETVLLAPHDVIFRPGGHIPFVYFPEGCVASIVKIFSDGKQIEVGTAGFEGMAGFPAFLDAATTPLECFIQLPGPARRLDANVFRAAAPAGSAFRGIMQRYSMYLFDQAAQTAGCNRLHSLDERCARWLLMTHDRVQGDRFELKQEFLATMLGVRRPGVSKAADDLKQRGFIRYSRGKVTIVNRAGLEGASCECYANDRADFERLLSQKADFTLAAS